MKTQKIGSSRIVIQPTPGVVERRYRPPREPKFARTGTGDNSHRTAQEPADMIPAIHRMMIKSRSIIDTIPNLG